MTGEPEAGAVAAARTFVAQRRGNQEVGVVTFNGNVNVLQAPTIDPGQLQCALASAPQLAYGTHIFDAVARSLKHARGGEDRGRLDRAPLRRCRRRQHEHAASRSSRPRRRRTSACSPSGFAPARSTATTLKTLAAQTGGIVRRGVVAEASSPASTPQLGSKLSREYLLDVPVARRAELHRSTCSVTLDGVGTGTSHYVAPTPSELPPYHRPFFRQLRSSRAGRCSCSRSSSRA